MVLVRTRRSTEKTLIMMFIFDTEPPPPLVFEFVVRHKAAWCSISIRRVVQFLFTAAGESALYSLALASNNGADSRSCILSFPSLGTPLGVPASKS